MIRLYIVCEGQTEEEFVNNLLFGHVTSLNVHPIPIIIGKTGRKGGNVEYQRLRTNIRNSLRQEIRSYCTTFVDFYGLPPSFPGKTEAGKKRILSDIAETFRSKFADALTSDLGENSMRRFIPYVQMHEFEALLFSDPVRFAVGISRSDLKPKFQNIRISFPTPEHINDSDKTAPR